MISYTIPSSHYRYEFPKGASNDHIDIDVEDGPAPGQYKAKLTLHTYSPGNSKAVWGKLKVSHPFLRVWITVPPGTFAGNKCQPHETGTVWSDVHGRTAYWTVRRMHAKRQKTFSVPFTLDGAKSVRLEFGLHSDELKVPVALQYDLQGAAIAPSLTAKAKVAAPKPKSADGGMAAGAEA